MIKPSEEKEKRKFSILPSPDPGFGDNYDRHSKRLINKDGSFNAHRNGVSSIFNLYQSLVNMKWGPFFALLALLYFTLNLLFACVYFFLGEDALSIDYATSLSEQFLQSYFFSVQTFTTIGYGGILPVSSWAGIVSSVEALFGLMFTALATGLFYGRFSRPKAKIVFSKNALISPYRQKQALMFRLANARNSQYTEMGVRLILTKEMKSGDKYKKQYFDLEVERRNIVFFPLSWTVVHPIDENSPLYGLSQEELVESYSELLILIVGYDDTFNQTVHCRHSYTFDEVVWDASFKRNFGTTPYGDIEINLDQIGDYQKL